jgi:hypothetical protein
MNGITQKATIAKAQVFSNSLKNSLMMNLISEYRLDNNVNDSWGNHNGAMIGTVIPSTDCIYGSCFYFNGSTYISIADDPDFNFGPRMTAMVWVKGAPQNTKTLISNWENIVANKGGWWMGSSENNPYDKLRVVITDDGSYNSTHDKRYYTTNAIAFDSNWHYVGFTWNSGTLKLYIDGVEAVATKGWDGEITSIYNNDVSINIGSYLSSGSPAGYLTGFMDDVYLYGAAIPTSQIKEQYYAGLNSLLSNGAMSLEEYSSRAEQLSSVEF